MTTGRPNRFLRTKNIFYTTLFIAAIIILVTWLSGTGDHRSLYSNALASTSMLAAGMFLFLAYGLYKGLKLKDNIGRLTDRIGNAKIPNLSGAGGIDLPNMGDSATGIISGILSWLVVSIIIVAFLWIFGVVLWAIIVAFTAMLYWIYFRAVKFVFRKSSRCKGNLFASAAYGFCYTLLYSFWIYGIILGIHYFVK